MNNPLEAVTQAVNSLVTALKLPDESAKANEVLGEMSFPQFSRLLIKGRISRRLPLTNSSGIGVELLPVEMTLDERPYPVFTRGNYEDQ